MPSHDFQHFALATGAMARLDQRVRVCSTLLTVAAAVALASAPPSAWAVDKKSALATISNAAQNDSASAASVTLETYAAAGVTGMEDRYLDAVNSALNSEAIDGCEANTTKKVQAIVNAYTAIMALANSGVPFPAPSPSATQFTAIGVTGLRHTEPTSLLNDLLFAKGGDKVNTVAKVQALADPVIHLQAAVGGTPAQVATLSVADFAKLGASSVTEANLPSAQRVIRFATFADMRDRLALWGLLKAYLEHDHFAARGVIATAAEMKSATNERLNPDLYATAGATGVDSSNLASINSAINSKAISGFDFLQDTFLQNLVNAYNAILRSADGVAGNTAQTLTGAQWRAVGVTGMGGLATAGTPLHLLNDVVDAAPRSAVDTVPKLQALADAAAHVVAGAGGETAAGVSAEDLQTLGIAGVDNIQNLANVRAALKSLASGNAVDTRSKLQSLVRASTRNDSHEPDVPPRIVN